MRTSRRRVIIPATIFSSGALIGACSIQGDTEDFDRISSPVVPNEAGDGYVTGDSSWDGNYNYCTYNCHHAANCGLQAGNDGIISCDGVQNGSLGGHAVNWDTVPCESGQSGTCYCISDPQSADNTPACCWNQAGGGPIDIGSGGGASCANSVCCTDGGQIAFDAGEQWDGGKLDCSNSTSSYESCITCCETANNAHKHWCKGKETTPACSTVNQWFLQCQFSCADTFLAPKK